MKLGHKGLVLVSVPLIFQFGFLAVLVVQLKEAEAEIDKQVNARAVRRVVDKLSKNFLEADVALSGIDSTRSPIFEDRYNEELEAIPKELKELRALLPDTVQNKGLMEKLSSITDEGLNVLRKARQSLDADPNSSSPQMHSAQIHSSMRFIAETLEKEFHDAIKAETQIDDEAPEKQKQRRAQLLQVIAAAAVVSVLSTVLLALFFAKGIAIRLGVLTENTKRVAAGKELADPLPGDDEISVVDESFHEMVRAQKEASRRKQELLSVVGHDLRSPLAALELTAELFSEGVLGTLNEKGQTAAARNLRVLKNLMDMINDLLDFEKLEAGHLKMERQKVQVAQIFDRVVDTLQPIAAEKKIKLEVDSKQLEANVDPDRIAQVLLNLMGNALKFSPENSTVFLSALGVKGGVQFKVRDEGRGIPPEKIKYVFDRFYQVKTEDGQSGKGTGLGLGICKGFVEAHGGKIGVQSKPPSGTTFWFIIPDS